MESPLRSGAPSAGPGQHPPGVRWRSAPLEKQTLVHKSVCVTDCALCQYSSGKGVAKSSPQGGVPWPMF